MEKLPVYVAGKNKNKNIVALEPISPTKAITYTRIFKSGVTGEERLRTSVVIPDIINWNSWFLVHNKEFAQNLNNYKYFNKRIFKIDVMRGNLHYKYYVKIVGDIQFWNLARIIVEVFNETFGTDFEKLNNITSHPDYKDEIYSLGRYEQVFIDTGITLFKGMSADDIKVICMDIETTGLDPMDSKIFLNSIYSNYGFKKLVYDENDNEENILLETEKILQEQDYDVLLTYNGAYFDNQFIRTRFNEVLKRDIIFGRKIQGEIPKIVYSTHSTTLKVGEATERFNPVYANGIHHIDCLHLVKRYNAVKRDMENHKLKYVAKYFNLDKKRDDDRTYIEGTEIYKTWLKDKNKVLKYAFDDTWETLELYKLLISSVFYLTQLTPSSFQKISHCGSATIWELLMLREYLRPQFSHKSGKYFRTSIPLVEKTYEFPGGFTDCEVVGIIDDVHKFDVGCVDEETEIWTKEGWKKYNEVSDNEIILTLNTETNKFEYQKVDKWNIYDYDGEMVEFDGPNINQILTPNHRCLVYKEEYLFVDAEKIKNEKLITLSMSDMNIEINNDYIKKNIKYKGKVWCPTVKNSTFIMKRNNKISITGNSLYPSIMLVYGIKPKKDILDIFIKILRYMTDLRLSIKKRKNELKKDGKDNTTEYKNIDGLQAALKIVINSAFGAMGSVFFSFNNPDGAKQVTTTGQKILKQMRELLIEHDCVPIILDTDGIIFYSKIKQNIQELNDYISSKLPEGINLEYEDNWKKLFSYKRKNYAMLEKDEKVKIKGSSLISSSKPKWVRDLFEEVLKLIFKEDFVGVNKLYREQIIKLRNREIPVEKLATRVKFSKTIDTYLKELEDYYNENGVYKARQAHMELLIDKFNKNKRIDYNIGEKIAYYKTGEKANESYLPKTLEPVYEICSKCNGNGCNSCVEGKIYKYIICESCNGEGYKIFNKKITRKNVKNNRNVSRLTFLAILYNIWLELGVIDLDNFDYNILSKGELNNILNSLKIDNFKTIENIKLNFNEDDMNKFLNDDFNNLVTDVEISGKALTPCRTCNNKKPLSKKGYVLDKKPVFRLNCRLVEDAPKEPDYNIAFYEELFNKSVRDVFINCFTDEDFNKIFSETVLDSDKNIKTISKSNYERISV